MDVKSYCDSLTIELTGWKAKVYDIVRKLDKMSSGDKEKVVPGRKIKKGMSCPVGTG